MIEVVIKVMPSGDEVNVELGMATTGKEIKKAIIGNGAAPAQDNQGNLIAYELISKASNQRIDDEKSLENMNVTNGETLFMVPDLIAG